MNAPTSDRPTEPSAVRSAPVVDTNVEIKEDAYYASIVDLKRDATVEFSIDLLAGPEVETWVLDPEGFREFERAGKSFFGGKFTHFPELRMTDVRKDKRSARLAAGRYYFLIENTDAGETKPPSNMQEDTATLRITVTAR